MMPTTKVRIPRDPSYQNFAMMEKQEQVNILGHEAKEFQERLAAEVSNTCSSSSTITLDLLETILFLLYS